MFSHYFICTLDCDFRHQHNAKKNTIIHVVTAQANGFMQSVSTWSPNETKEKEKRRKRVTWKTNSIKFCIRIHNIQKIGIIWFIQIFCFDFFISNKCKWFHFTPTMRHTTHIHWNWCGEKQNSVYSILTAHAKCVESEWDNNKKRRNNNKTFKRPNWILRTHIALLIRTELKCNLHLANKKTFHLLLAKSMPFIFKTRSNMWMNFKVSLKKYVNLCIQ